MVTYTVDAQHVVPAGVHLYQVTLRGASGANGWNALGGRGAVVVGVLAVTPEETLYIHAGATPGTAADIRRGGSTLAHRVAVAGAGGSAGDAFTGPPASGYGGTGGDAGHPAGSSGTTASPNGSNTPGGGGTQTTGGIPNGGLGVAGGGQSGGGKGGEGYYGGGGGVREPFTNSNGPGGGGGSSYTGGLTDATTSMGPAVSGGTYGATVELVALDSPPDAPILTSMTSGVVVDRATGQRASHTHSDPNGDPQTAFRHRWRLVGASTWTTVEEVTTAQWYDFAPGQLVAGDYERQVATKAAGVWGPYSPSGFFTAADAPNTPAIIEPANGSTAADPTITLAWLADNQDAYRVRRVADDGAGAPDTDVVYADTGQVTDTTTRTVEIMFTVNDRVEHLQVQVLADGLWSEWASVMVTVDYSTTAAPVFTIAPDAGTGSLLVTVSNPSPGAGELETVWNDVYVTEPVDGVVVEQRRATAVTPGGTWRYWTPVSGWDYEANVRVVAYGANGAGTSS